MSDPGITHFSWQESEFVDQTVETPLDEHEITKIHDLISRDTNSEIATYQ